MRSAANKYEVPYTTSPKVLSVTLDEGIQPKTLFTCGDRIGGKVHFRPQSELTFDSVSISLKCKLKVFITEGSGESRTTHKSKVVLLCLSKTLTRGLRTIAPGPTEQALVWSFEFVFPWEVMPGAMTHPFKSHPYFEHQAGHALPPSYYRSQASTKVMVDYFLEAHVHKPHAIFRPDLKDQMYLVFSPSRAAVSPTSAPAKGVTTFSCQSRLLDPARRGEDLSFLTKVHRAFGGGPPDPIARFRITAVFPTVVCIDAPIPITLESDYIYGSTAPEQPEIYLQGAHARLTAYTKSRVPTKHLFGEGQRQRSFDFKVEVPTKRAIAGTPIYNGMVLREHTGGLIIHSSVPPTFKTYSLAQSYKLKVSIWVKCADKDRELVIADREILLLPGIYRAPPGGEAQTDVMSRQTSNFGDMIEAPGFRRTSIETLPVYREIEENPPPSIVK